MSCRAGTGPNLHYWGCCSRIWSPFPTALWNCFKIRLFLGGAPSVKKSQSPDEPRENGEIEAKSESSTPNNADLTPPQLSSLKFRPRESAFSGGTLKHFSRGRFFDCRAGTGPNLHYWGRCSRIWSPFPTALWNCFKIRLFWGSAPSVKKSQSPDEPRENGEIEAKSESSTPNNAELTPPQLSSLKFRPRESAFSGGTLKHFSRGPNF